MSATNATTTDFADDAASRPAVRTRLGFAERIAAWMRRSNTRAELARLTDRQLEDIGLTRHQVSTMFSFRR